MPLHPELTPPAPFLSQTQSRRSPRPLKHDPIRQCAALPPALKHCALRIPARADVSAFSRGVSWQVAFDCGQLPRSWVRVGCNGGATARRSSCCCLCVSQPSCCCSHWLQHLYFCRAKTSCAVGVKVLWKTVTFSARSRLPPASVGWRRACASGVGLRC
jgi:hypothetical protein